MLNIVKLHKKLHGKYQTKLTLNHMGFCPAYVVAVVMA